MVGWTVINVFSDEELPAPGTEDALNLEPPPPPPSREEVKMTNGIENEKNHILMEQQNKKNKREKAIVDEASKAEGDTGGKGSAVQRTGFPGIMELSTTQCQVWRRKKCESEP